MTLVQEIHEKFEALSDREYALNVLKSIDNNRYYLSEEEFCTRFDLYKELYPNTPFVHWGAVQEICAEYGLFMGASFMFSEIVPTEALNKLADFRFHDADYFNRGDYCDQNTHSMEDSYKLYGDSNILEGGSKGHGIRGNYMNNDKPLNTITKIDGSGIKGSIDVTENMVTYNPAQDDLTSYKLFGTFTRGRLDDIFNMPLNRHVQVGELSCGFGSMSNDPYESYIALNSYAASFNNGNLYLPLFGSNIILANIAEFEDISHCNYDISFGGCSLGRSSFKDYFRTRSFQRHTYILVQSVYDYHVEYRAWPLKHAEIEFQTSRDVGRFPSMDYFWRSHLEIKISLQEFTNTMKSVMESFMTHDKNHKVLPLIVGDKSMFASEILSDKNRCLFLDLDKFETAPNLFTGDPLLFHPANGGGFLIHKWGEHKDIEV